MVTKLSFLKELTSVVVWQQFRGIKEPNTTCDKEQPPPSIYTVHLNAQENKLPKSDAKRQYRRGGSKMDMTLITWLYTCIWNAVSSFGPHNSRKKPTNQLVQFQWRAPSCLEAGALTQRCWGSSLVQHENVRQLQGYVTAVCHFVGGCY